MQNFEQLQSAQNEKAGQLINQLKSNYSITRNAFPIIGHLQSILCHEEFASLLSNNEFITNLLNLVATTSWTLGFIYTIPNCRNLISTVLSSLCSQDIPHEKTAISGLVKL